MLTVHHISKSFGVETVLDAVSFNLNAGERIGLVGPNGCGKTTLLRILAGIDRPDSGAVQWAPPDLRVGYLPQGLSFRSDETLDEYLHRWRDDVPALSVRVEHLAEALARAPAQESLQQEYDAALAHLSAACSEAGRAPSVLAALGLADVPSDTRVALLSGGQKTRLALAGVLLSNPRVLLLDEPTNHLDVAMLEWLEQWLRDFRGAALVVSHDRTFLDRAVTRILDLDPFTHTVREYAGNYTGYVEQKLAERERQWSQWRDQEYETRRMKQDIAQTKQHSLRVELSTTAREPGVRRIAKKVAKKAKSREKKLEHYLESDERVEKPKLSWQMKLDFGAAPSSGRDVVVLDQAAVGYGNHMLLRDLNLYVRQGARVALVGPNGAGKTTLLRAIAGALPPLSGRLALGANVRIGYMAQEQETLDPSLNVLDTLRAIAPMTETALRAFLHLFLFSGDAVFTPAGLLSFGERARLLLACLVARGCNLLLLDEPINHLDIPSRTCFEQALATFEGTVIAAVHDRYFIQQFATELWRIERGTIVKQVW